MDSFRIGMQVRIEGEGDFILAATYPDKDGILVNLINIVDGRRMHSFGALVTDINDIIPEEFKQILNYRDLSKVYVLENEKWQAAFPPKYFFGDRFQIKGDSKNRTFIAASTYNSNDICKHNVQLVDLASGAAWHFPVVISQQEYIKYRNDGFGDDFLQQLSSMPVVKA